MSFADEKPRSIVSAWGKTKITLAEACSCGDLIAIDSGNNWDLAEGSTPKLAMFVAGEDGAIGDQITAYAGAVVRGEGPTGFAAVAGEIGDLVYLSDTAGEYSTTAGTRAQPVGLITKTNEIHVDLFDAARVAGVTTAWLHYDGVGFMSAGTYSVPVLSTAAGEAFYELWAKCSGAGHVYGQRLNIQVTNVAATSSQALRAELDLYPSTAGAPAGGSAGHFAAELGALATGVTGLFAGLNASLILSAATRSLQGTYCALSLQSQIKAGNTMPGATTSFIRMADAETLKMPLLFDTEGMATASDGAWEATADALDDTVLGYYKVRTAAGDGYIPVLGSH